MKYACLTKEIRINQHNNFKKDRCEIKVSFLFFSFCHSIPEPGIEFTPHQWSEPQQWQH